MDFSNRKHKKAYERIRDMMVELFGEAGAIPYDDRPGWIVPSGSAVVHVSVTSWHDDKHLVQITAYLTSGTELTPSCLRFLLEESSTTAFGGYAVDSDQDIAFKHSTIAETCSKEELKTIVMAVASTADGQDDLIVQRWGGKRAND